MRFANRLSKTHRAFFLLSLALMACFLLIDVFALARLAVARIERPDKVQVSTGLVTFTELGRYQGSIITMTSAGHERKTFSCATPGWRKFSGCVRYEPWMDGSEATITWFDAPSGLFVGVAKRPLSVEFIREAKRYELAQTPVAALDSDLLLRGGLLAGQVIFFSLIACLIYFLLSRMEDSQK